MEPIQQRGLLSWVFLGALLALCGTLGFLQYRWIGEVSRAERDRLRASLQESLEQLGQDVNLEIGAQVRAILPPESEPSAVGTEKAVLDRYAQWRKATRRAGIFRRIGIVKSDGEAAWLRLLNMEEGAFQNEEWPASWKGIEQRMALRVPPDISRRGNVPGFLFSEEGLVFEQFVQGAPPFPWRMRGPFDGGPFRGRGIERGPVERLIFELDGTYLQRVLLPELLQGHLVTKGSLSYEVAVLTRGRAPAVIYPADAEQARRIARAADASVILFYPQSMQAPRLPGPGGPPQQAREPDRGPPPAAGRWQMFARHRAGSLEAVVSRARGRNLAVTGGVLLLLMASAAALVRFTRRAQRLAELQMDFVAGVSHELRTPLTVIHTAAYNLRGKLANDPGQVEKYGELIQRESGRLAEMVDEVLQFAGSATGRAILEREPVYVEDLIEEALESSKATMEGAGCVVEKTIDPELPPVLGDPSALKQVFSNLLSNAAKHGGQVDGWIGIAATKARENGRDAIEVRVSDRGPGIPADEQRQVFDPFFRGRRAVREQIHGSGLGLNLVKRIVEAHGGTIRVRSEPGKLTEFTVHLTALAEEQK